MNFFGGHVVILKGGPIMRCNSFWLKMCSTALCFTKAFSGMLKQVDKIKMISSKLFIKNSLLGWTTAGPNFHKMKNVQVHRHYYSALSLILVHTTRIVNKSREGTLGERLESSKSRKETLREREEHSRNLLFHHNCISAKKNVVHRKWWISPRHTKSVN